MCKGLRLTDQQTKRPTTKLLGLVRAAKTYIIVQKLKGGKKEIILVILSLGIFAQI